MRDFLPDDLRRREYVIGVIAQTYRRYGFEPLETPALENIETLTGKYGEEGSKLIFKVLRRGEHESSGETDLALRYDLTVPLARVVAEHRGRLPRFFKRYQIQPVWRADRPSRGRFREFYQCDVDAIGSTSPVVEAEVCGAVSDVLRELGFQDFSIRLNHRGLLRGMLDTFGVPAGLQDSALIAVDKLDKLGRDGVAAELAARGVDRQSAGRLLDAFADRLDGPARSGEATHDAMTAWARAQVGEHADGNAAVSNVAEILRLCRATSAGDHVLLDPSLARGLSYYTGAIMEVAVADLAGSLGGGGRYDGLIGMFGSDAIPACGFSLGLERILVVMGERKMFPPGLQRASADVMVTLFDGEPLEEGLRLAADLRRGGLRVELYPEPDKIGKQFKYASGRGIRYVAVAGGSERANGSVTIKDMQTGEQSSAPREEIAGALALKLRADS
jgi:histidyl-tRNA synthetase